MSKPLAWSPDLSSAWPDGLWYLESEIIRPSNNEKATRGRFLKAKKAYLRKKSRRRWNTMVRMHRKMVAAYNRYAGSV